MYDDICKFIAETFSQDLASWLLGEPIELTVLEPTELQVAPIRADSLILLASEDTILHIEFQVDPKVDIPFRMADYRLRVYRRFPTKKIYQVVIYLRKTRSALVRQTTFELPEMRHRYQVIRLWEIPSEQLLKSSGLLPFAVLSQTENPVEILQEVARKINNITDKTAQNDLFASTAIIAGLVLDKMIIQRLLKEETMKESVIYQEIIAKGLAEGREEGREEGRKEGESNLILKLLHRRIGLIRPDIAEKIRQLSIEQLENLGIALLDFNSEADLVNWFNQAS